MFKPLIAATVGLSAMATLASADTIIVQSGPNSAAPSIIAYDGPSLDRMVEICARIGFDCGVSEHAEADGPHPLFSEEAQADAEKRIALMRLDWEEYAANLPGSHAFPQGPSAPFGWRSGPDARDILSWIAPRHAPLAGQFPHAELPRVTPNGHPFGWNHGLSTLPRSHGFWGPITTPRLTVPRLEMPRIAAPHIVLPRPSAPHFAHPRTLPHGGLIPWPTL